MEFVAKSETIAVGEELQEIRLCDRKGVLIIQP